MLEIASINPIVINRLSVAHGFLSTVCTSEIQQVSINNSSHLTILDPKLPLLHEVLARSASSDDPRSFNCNALFTITSIIPWENLTDAGVGYFSKVVLGDAEVRFNFGRISEPQIVHHEWSPMDDSTRDCYLGVLSNSGEFFLLRRETLDSGNYVVKQRLLAFLFDRLQLPMSRYSADNDLVMNSNELLFIRVNNFLFGKLESGAILLSLAHDNGTILIYTIGDELNLISTIKVELASIVLLVWSPHSNSFFYLTKDNSIYESEVNTASQIQNFTKLKNSSRFAISKMINCGDRLIAVDTESLHVCNRDMRPLSIGLPNHSVAAGMHILKGKRCDYILIVYEGGKSSIVKLLKKSLELLPELDAWNHRMSFIRQASQNVYRKEQTKAILRVFAPYLNDNIDADVLIHGTTIVFGKNLLLVHSNAPKNATSHVVLSLKQFTISFVPLVAIRADIHFEFRPKSSFSFLIDLFLETVTSLPLLNKGVLDGSGAATKAFLDNITTWRETQFHEEHLEAKKIEPLQSLTETLCQFFRDEKSISLKQKRYSLNLSILKTLTTLASNPESIELVETFRNRIQFEQKQIVCDIRHRLATVITSWATANHTSISWTDIDIFVLRSLMMATKLDKLAVPLSSTAKLTLSTDLCTESFLLDNSENLNSDYIISKSGHGWKRCDLTLLPILDLSNGSDELEKHSYLSTESHGSLIIASMFDSISYCIYTGTRKKTIVAGI